MKQQVIYSMLAMAAPVAVVQQVQAADVDALASTAQTAATSSKSIFGEILAKGTYKVNINGLTLNTATKVQITVSYGTTEKIFDYDVNGDYSIEGIELDGATQLNVSVVATGASDATFGMGIVVDFPDAAIQYSSDFTTRYNKYDGIDAALATKLGIEQKVKENFNSEAVHFLIATFKTYENYQLHKLWEGTKIEDLKTLTAAGDALQSEIAQFQADYFAAKYAEQLDIIGNAETGKLKDAQDRINKLDNNNATKTTLQDELNGLITNYENWQKAWNSRYYGEDVTNENLSAEKKFNGTDDIYNFLKDGTQYADLETFATTTMDNFIAKIKDSATDYSKFLQVQSWQTAAVAALKDARTALDAAIEGKLIDITKDGEGKYTADSQAKALEEAYTAAQTALESYFDISKETADVNSIGYAYYNNTLFTTWNGGEDMTQKTLKLLVLDKIDALKNVGTGAIDVAKKAYADRIEKIETALDAAIGTKTDATGKGGAYGAAITKLGSDADLNFKITKPADDSEVDVYATWRDALKFKGAGTGTAEAPADGTLDKEQTEDFAIYTELVAAKENGTVLSWDKADNHTGLVNLPTVYSNIVDNATNGTVAAKTINDKYKEQIGKTLELDAELETVWAGISDEVKADNPTFKDEYDNIKARTGKEGMQKTIYDLMMLSADDHYNFPDGLFDQFPLETTGRTDIDMTQEWGPYATYADGKVTVGVGEAAYKTVGDLVKGDKYTVRYTLEGLTTDDAIALLMESGSTSGLKDGSTYVCRKTDLDNGTYEDTFEATIDYVGARFGVRSETSGLSLSKVSFIHLANNTIEDLKAKAATAEADYAAYQAIVKDVDGGAIYDLKKALGNVVPTGTYEAKTKTEVYGFDFVAVPNIDVSVEKWGYAADYDNITEGYLFTNVKEKLQGIKTAADAAYAANPRTIQDYKASIEGAGKLLETIETAINTYKTESAETKAQYGNIDETVKGYIQKLADVKKDIDVNIYNNDTKAEYMYDSDGDLTGDMTYEAALKAVAVRINTITNNLKGLASKDTGYKTDVVGLDLDADALTGIAAELDKIAAQAPDAKESFEVDQLKMIYTNYSSTIDPQITAAKAAVTKFITDELTDDADKELLGQDIQSRFFDALKAQADVLLTDVTGYAPGSKGDIKDLSDDATVAFTDETTAGAGYTTRKQFEDGIKELERIEKAVKAIVKDKISHATTEEEKAADGSLYDVLEKFKALVAAEKALKADVDEKIAALEKKIADQRTKAADLPYEYDVVEAYDNGGTTPGETLEATLAKLKTDVNTAYASLNLTLSNDGDAYADAKEKGQWELPAGAALKDVYAKLSAAEGNVDESVDAWIKAYDNAQANALAVRDLKTAIYDASNYVKAHREGYDPDTQDYLKEEPTTVIPAIADAAKSDDTSWLNDTWKNAAVKTFNDQLDDLQTEIDGYAATVAGYDAESDEAKKQSKKAGEGEEPTLMDKLLAIKAAAEQVTADAQDNVSKFDAMLKFLTDEATENAGAAYSLKKFNEDITAGQDIETKADWQKVAADFQSGKKTLGDEGIKLPAGSEKYTSVIVDDETDGIDEWKDKIRELYAAGKAGVAKKSAGEYVATYEKLGNLNTAIITANNVFKGTYVAQVNAENATAWEQVKTQMQLLREEFAKAKKLLDDNKKEAQGTDLEEVVNNAAEALNKVIFDYPTEIDAAETTARGHYDAAESDDPIKLYKNATDLAAIKTLYDNISLEEDGFMEKVKDHLNHYWNGGTTTLGKIVDYGTGKAVNYDLTGWKAKITTAPAYVVDKALTAADPDVVYADVIEKIELAKKYATSATEWQVGPLAAAVTELDANFETWVKKDLYDAAKIDVTARLTKLGEQITADKEAFELAYNNLDETADPMTYKNQVFAEIYAALFAEIGNAEQGENKVVKADGKGLQDEALEIDGEKRYGVINLSQTAAQALFDAATEANLADTERAKILAAIDLYDTYYNTDPNSIVNRADKAAADYETKWKNAADVTDGIAALKTKLETATTEILKTYVAEDYRAALATYTADKANETNHNSLAYLNGLDPKDPETKTAIADAETDLDATIALAYNAEKGKLNLEFNELYSDYNDIYTKLDDAVTAAQKALDENTDPEKVTELTEALDKAKTARTEFTENDGAEPYSYYERVKAALTVISTDIATPVTDAEMDKLKTLVAEEPIIAALRTELAAKNQGVEVKDLTEPLIAALNTKAEAISTDVLGEETDYLPYDWAALSAEKKAIDTDLANAKAAIAAHEADIMMYNDQLTDWLTDIEGDVAALTAKVDPAKADKTEYDALVAANTAALERLNGKAAAGEAPAVPGEIDVLTEALSLAQKAVEDLGDDPAKYFDGVEKSIEALKQAVVDRAAQAASDGQSSVDAGNTNWKTVPQWLTATTSKDDFVTTAKYTTYADIEAVIADQIELAAYNVAKAYEAAQFEGAGLQGKRTALLALCVESRYKASVLQDIKKELGVDTDTKKEESIYGAIVEMFDAIEASNTITTEHPATTNQADLATHKAAVDAIVERLEKVEKALESQLLGDLNAALTGGDSGDGDVDVQDLQILINLVTGVLDLDDTELTAEQKEAVLNAADIDDDGELTINDVTCLANFILTGARYYDWENDVVIAPARQMSNDELLNAELIAQEGNQRTYAITLQNTRQYSAFQMDIVLPEGMTLVSKSLTDRSNNHRLYFNQMGQVNRVVVHNIFNNNLKANEGAVLTFTVEGEGEVSYDKILFSQADGKMYQFTLGAQTTGIMDRMANAYDAAKQKVYNLGGRMMDGMKKGINILRGENGDSKKVIKK